MVLDCSNMSKNKVIAVILFTFAIAIAIFTCIKTPQKCAIKNYSSIYKPVQVNIALKNKINPDDLDICFDSNCVKSKSEVYDSVYHAGIENEPVKNISYKFNGNSKDIQNNIEDILIYVGHDRYQGIDIPKIDNSTSILNKIYCFILTFFYNFKYFIFSWILILCGSLLLVRDNFEIKRPYVWLILITVLAFILRINNLSYTPLWCAENYTIEVAMENFKTLFKDAGNPPLFFILEYLFTYFLPKTLITYRLFPALCGIALPIAVYFTLKDGGKVSAIIGAFLAAISINSIFYSQEARGYSFFMLLSVLIVYFLFRYLKNKNLKNLILYTVCAISLINSYYYLILLTVAAFIWGSVYLLKDKKELIKFLIANAVAFLSFAPWAFYMMKEALSNHFNLWIPKLSFAVFVQIIHCYFLNIILFLVFALILISNIIMCLASDIKKNEEKKKLLYFLIFAILFIIISTILISIYVKPIFHFKFYASIYGLFILLETILITSPVEFKNKNKGLVYSFLILLLFLATTSRTLTRTNILKPLADFIVTDSVKYKDEYNIYALNPGNSRYINVYPELKSLDYINWKIYESDYGEFVNEFNKSEYTKKGKGIVYFTEIGIDRNNIKIIKPYKVYFYNTNNGIPVAKIVFLP